MEAFPILRSGAVVQFPVRREQGAVEVNVEFWGGGGQSYVRKRASAPRWVLRYVGLSEEELSRLLAFCENHEDSGTLFPFRDPISGTVHDQCWIEPNSIDAAGPGSNSCEFGVTIVRVEE